MANKYSEKGVKIKKIITTLAVGLSVCAAQAEITTLFGASLNIPSRTITVTETAVNTYSSIASSGTGVSAMGTSTATGLIGSFEMTFDAYSDWGQLAGATALAGGRGALATYIRGLTPANLTFNKNTWGVVGGNNNFRLDNPAGDPAVGEVVVLTFNTSGLTSGYQLVLKGVDTIDTGVNEIGASHIDIYVYNVGSGTVTDSVVDFDISRNNDWAGTFKINDGDLLIMKSSILNTDTDSFGFSGLTFDVIPGIGTEPAFASSPAPEPDAGSEPIAVGLISIFGGALLFVRQSITIIG